MRLELRSLIFGRTTLGGRPAAIPVRATRESGDPPFDWRRQGAIQATAVAYPIALTQDDIEGLSITVAFTVRDPPTRPVFVRARAEGSELLGTVDSLQIAAADLTRPQRFRLTGPRLREASIGEQTVRWRWEFRTDPAEMWQPFDESTHRVFAIHDEPDVPWGRPGSDVTISPWDEVLVLACTWAKGRRDEDAVRTALTKGVFGLADRRVGNVTIEYGGFGSLGLTDVLAIDTFMNIVKRQPPVPGELNCRDLNGAVMLLATLLGCSLRMLCLRPRGGRSAEIHTNPIMLFGRPRSERIGFGSHEVAATPGVATDARRVWDACLQIDRDSEPHESPPDDFGLPAGLAIADTPMAIGYRRRFLRSISHNCLIRAPYDGLRYPGSRPPGVPPPASGPCVEDSRDYFASLMTNISKSEPRSIDHANEFLGWLADATDAEGFRRPVHVRAGLLPASFTPLIAGVTGGRYRASVFVASSPEQAKDVFLSLAAEYVGSLERCILGDFALHDATFGAVLILRGPVVTIVHSGGTVDRELPASSALTEAGLLDNRLALYFRPR